MMPMPPAVGVGVGAGWGGGGARNPMFGEFAVVAGEGGAIADIVIVLPTQNPPPAMHVIYFDDFTTSEYGSHALAMAITPTDGVSNFFVLPEVLVATPNGDPGTADALIELADVPIRQRVLFGYEGPALLELTISGTLPNEGDTVTIGFILA
jgi:hypothetical protein